jgi:hypothetical protein
MGKDKGGTAMKKALKILACIAAVIAVVFGVYMKFMDNAAKADHYEMGNDKIPSVKLVLGEVRKVKSLHYSYKNNYSARTIGYSTDPGDQAQAAGDMEKYVRYLRENEGFVLSKSGESHQSVDGGPFIRGVQMTLVKNSVDDGMSITLDIDYNAKGYKLQLTKTTGRVMKY